MKAKWLIGLFIYIGCSNIEIAQPIESQLNQAIEGKFFTVNTKEINPTALVNEVEFVGEIKGGEACIKEVGFFYSMSQDDLFASEMTFQDLTDNKTDIHKVIVDPEKVRLIGNTYKEILTLPQEDTTFFFRSYAIFNENCEDRKLERIHLSPESKKKHKYAVRGGWYKKRYTGELWDRNGAFVVPNEDLSGVVVGSGCAYASHCANNIESYPFLEFDFSSDSITIIEKDNCPREKSKGPIYNRMDAVAFRIQDSIFLGTGRMNNEQLGDFYVYSPSNCSARAATKSVPTSFLPRTKAVGFSIDGVGYVGLGHEKRVTNALDDFWKYDANHPDSQWIKLNLIIDPEITNLARSGATVFTTNEGFAVIGGGKGSNARELNDVWKFTPLPEQNSAKIEPMGKLIGRDGEAFNFSEGVGFQIDGQLYLGLGNRNQDFFKYNGVDWDLLAPSFPGASVSNPVSFTIQNRGYIFTGSSNDNNDVNLSQDLWIYIPE